MSFASRGSSTRFNWHSFAQLLAWRLLLWLPIKSRKSYLTQKYFFSILSLTWTSGTTFIVLLSKEKTLRWKETHANTHTHTHTHTSTNTSQHESKRINTSLTRVNTRLTRVNTNEHESNTSQNESNTQVNTNQHESNTSQQESDTSQHDSTRV